MVKSMKPASLEHQESQSATAHGSGARLAPHARKPRGQPPEDGEPRTGVVRKVEHGTSAASVRPKRPSKKGFASGIVRRLSAPAMADSPELEREKSRAWRCLEWAAVPDKPAPSEPPAPRVSIAQITAEGQLVRQSGPNEALPEMVQFIHLMSARIAQGLGFTRCRVLCLRGDRSALSVARASASRVVGVTGPLHDMSNVLRRMDLE
jgi:hypothetical protein